jgi:hypothetical protein
MTFEQYLDDANLLLRMLGEKEATIDEIRDFMLNGYEVDTAVEDLIYYRNNKVS